MYCIRLSNVVRRFLYCRVLRFADGFLLAFFSLTYGVFWVEFFFYYCNYHGFYFGTKPSRVLSILGSLVVFLRHPYSGCDSHRLADSVQIGGFPRSDHYNLPSLLSVSQAGHPGQWYPGSWAHPVVLSYGHPP